MSGDKRVIVGGNSYVIDEGPEGSERNIDAIVAEFRRAMTSDGLAEIPVLDGDGKRMTLLLRGGDTGPVVLDLGLGPRPNEMSP